MKSYAIKLIIFLAASILVVLFLTKKNEIFVNETTAEPNTSITTDENNESYSNAPEGVSGEFILYEVESGDTLYDLAGEFDIKVSEIKKINNLENNKILPKQLLKIPSRNSVVEQADYEDPETVFAKAKNKSPVLTQSNVESGSEDSGGDAQGLTEEDQSNVPQKDIVIGDGEIINIQTEMDIKDLIQTMSEITGDAYILDEAVKGKKVTIIAPEGGFKKQNAVRIFETILDLNGFSIVKMEGLNKIVPKRDIKSEGIPTEIGKSYGDSSDSFITKIVPLKNIRAAEVANILRPLVSKEGDVVVFSTLNSLIIIERIDNLNRVLKLIENFDQETEIEFIKIHNADAAEVAEKLLAIFGVSGTISQSARSSQTSAQRTAAQRRRAAQQQRTTQVSTGGSSQSSLAGFKIITDERTNSLIVIAYPEDMKKIKSMISLLDVESEIEQDGIYVIKLQNADADQVVGVLSSLFGGGGGFRQSASQRTLRGGGTGLGRSTLGERETGTGLGGIGQSRQAIARRTGGAIGAVAAQMEDLRITSDPATNSIIIVGSRRDYEIIKRVIEELDVRRKQVFVEAAILEVSLDKIRQLGTNFSFGFRFNEDNLGFGGTQLPGVPSLLGVAASGEATTNIIGNLSGLFLGVIGEEVDPDGSGPIPPIPSFSALFTALTSLTDVNVLSTPSIITTDNEPAEIVVADVIPFPTGSTIGDSGVTVQTIQREPVGIRLLITPQIGEGDYLKLNIYTEVSSIAPTPADLNTAEFGIATNTRTADSSVVVKNGQTIVIGGLVQDREAVIENRVPLLGRLPILGNLFKFKSRQSTKINLLILITPRIVESEEDMQNILEERQRRNMLLQERGFNREDI